MRIQRGASLSFGFWKVAAAVGASGALLGGCGPSVVDGPEGNGASAGTGAAAGSGVGGVAGGGTGGSTGGDAGSSGTGAVTGCYSPTKNVSSAYEPGAKGCACDSEKDEAVCVKNVGLVCDEGAWQAVEDGPCSTQVPIRYSPDECRAAGGIPVPSPGNAQTPEKDCESGVALGIIDFASSGWDEGGLCCAADEDQEPTGIACGARAGDTCSPQEYCAYQEGQLCGAADAEAVCAAKPENCIELYAPVCGCDRKTYDNSCFANAAGTGILSAGRCAD